MALLIGIDVGTTGTKTVLTDENGQILATAYQGYRLYCKNKFVEQDADDWWKAVVFTVRKCVKEGGRKDKISAISISSQGATLVPVDKNGIPLRSAIVWMDTRADKQAAALRKLKSDYFFYRKTGWRLANSFNLVQIKWLKDNEYELFQKTGKFLTTIDYINWKLTGRFCIDPTNAGITQLFNIDKKKWDEEILNTVGLKKSKLSAVVESGEIIGTLTPDSARSLGLDTGVKVISGGHDQYCAALAAGVNNNGDVLLSTGTSWVVLSILDKPVFGTDNNFAIGRHLIKDMWGALAYTPTGGAALEWGRKQFFGNQDFAEINRQIEKISPGANGVMFFPNFAGTACPTWSLNSKGAILGLNLNHDRYHVARSLMEGVAFNINWILEALKQKNVALNCLRMQGGATKSGIWPKIVAEITGIPVNISKVPDMSCIGAVILGGYGAGIFKSLLDGCRRFASWEETIEPDIRNVTVYSELFELYKSRFNALMRIYEV